ncbi:MAG: diaminopimelate decarboxylase [Candidatus Sumerlaeaceae bacterium]
MTATRTSRPTHDKALLESIAAKVGTPFWLYDASVLRARIREVISICEAANIQPRYAMKACSATRVLQEMRAHNVWIDAVSGNECLRAINAGYNPGNNPPEVLLTADVFRDNALQVIKEHGLLINIGSPGQIRELERAGYKGPIAMRLNPGFGHGHVNSCDTGGPSSKHGIWWTHAHETADAARKAGMRVTVLHAHIGSGPQMAELVANLSRLAEEFAELAPKFPDLEGFSLGGGIPHNYRDDRPDVDTAPLGPMFAEARKTLSDGAGRELRIEIEPGRYYVAPMGTLVARVADVKTTESNEKGVGQTFAMVDAGFVDLLRPAMYGSYHRIAIPGREGEALQPVVVAGPLCESGDVFTRDASELLAPRPLPMPEPGDLLCLHDGGAYGYAMASNYNSIGRAPQVWLENDGGLTLISRRETLDDVLKAETSEKL